MDSTTPRDHPALGAPQASAKRNLYAAHEKIHPRNVKGVFRSLKWIATWTFIGLYLILPWFRWDRGGGSAPDQAFLFDIPGRRAYFMWIEIWPQEVYYLTGILIFAAVGLFLATALAGRLWCGFLCPQTVWTDIFVWIERLVEGERNARIRLDKAPWSVGKLWKKTVKHFLWAFVGFVTGYAFVLYFDDAFKLTVDIFSGQASSTIYLFLGLFTSTTYFFAAFAREQICIYMCPWPRFQSAMFDEHSLIVTYEDWRGEPRGKFRKGQDFKDRGDCVDCGLCFHVCPTGVDIRKGNQLACIGCALCVDACNAVMDRFSRPRGLVSYDSIFNQNARAEGKPTGIRCFRPRTAFYGLVLIAVTGAMIFSLITRDTLEINVLRDRAPLFVRLSDGGIRNGYTYKILNMEQLTKSYTLTVEGIEGATIEVIGHAPRGSRVARLPVPPDDVGAFRVLVAAGPEALDGKATDLEFVLKDNATGLERRHGAVFAGPKK